MNLKKSRQELLKSNNNEVQLEIKIFSIIAQIYFTNGRFGHDDLEVYSRY